MIQIKRIFFFVAAALLSLPAAAQLTLDGSKFWDNWSLGANMGVITPVRGAFFGDMRPTVGVELTKMVTPRFGLAFEGRTAFNTTPSATAVDALALNVLGKLNLSNVFAAYTGRPRNREAELFVGGGYIRHFGNGAVGSEAFDRENWNVKAGVSALFNVGKDRAWQINIRPAIVFLMDPGGRTQGLRSENAAFELTAGVAYRFINSNRTHHFTIARLYNRSRIDALNAKINDLMAMELDKEEQIARLRRQVAELEKEIGDLSREAEAEKPEATARPSAPVARKRMLDAEGGDEWLQAIVLFQKGKAEIETSQQTIVKQIATYLENHPDATVLLRGYASPEGSKAANRRLATQRAEAVKTMLTELHGISAERIRTEERGNEPIFSKREWNRACICTLVSGQ